MATLNKICLHWTAGSNYPCKEDLAAYHYCVDKYGRIYAGKHKPEDNLNCYDGNYAMHCGGGNTGCIGLSVCGMAGFTTDKNRQNIRLLKNRLNHYAALQGIYL